jgi:hypothetical protein
MASNFGIVIGKSSDGLNLKLSGDFDGTSAYELINVLKSCPEDIPTILIHTTGLKRVAPFGRDLFLKFLYSMDKQSSKIAFTGEKGSSFSLEKRRTC